ncbi:MULTISPECIES: YifB family Mg chelatase-like AAA ATPase [Metabacillus]|uniref:Magnesium chelatase n=2 Tax=Metabacillus TaxID=2675233 RepID=A0A179T494_9BACI|nr:MULTISPECIES: YifB family Mg chelatase-like AAA ATPase [Metabacillus]OAS88200.1 magnesium chelatase [Metabacillus litoralis]QNF27369.1 YifB family Mg chelatase-like AAA ATPase [Metabacillus sp. KUDC1714]
MTVKISSIGLRGLEGYRVQVEVQVSAGKESMVIVGLPDASVKESKERVLSAVRTLNCDVTDQKIVVNLSPSEQKKNGPFFDLAMAIGVLKDMGEFKGEIPEDSVFIGVLSLDGTVEKVEGMLPALIAAKTLGFMRVYLPYDPLLPVEMLEGLECIVIQHINEVLQHLDGQGILPLHDFMSSQTTMELTESTYKHSKDFCHIIGHEQAKEALEIAAAGEHNVLMSGPPGCGKSLLAETFPSILPPLTKEAQLEVISLYQLAKEQYLSPQIAPYRSPHHSASSVAIIGGGSYPKPGEISLAHRGVLFLDEMAEFQKKTLDMLRQPLEAGKVTISRSHSTVKYPSSFILIAAMNPCPCGFLGTSTHYCTCTAKQIQSYKNRISGPVYDRIDILLFLQSVNLNQPVKKVICSADIREKVEQARERQYERYQEQVCNAKIPFETLMKTSPLKEHQLGMIRQVASKQQWSNRVQIKIIRLARTISDLEGSREITDESIWKGITLRREHHRKAQIKAGER